MQYRESHNTQIFNLATKRLTKTYTYTAEISTKIRQGKKSAYNATALEFEITFYGMNMQGLFNCRIEIQKRFLLNEKFSVVKKLNKAQQLALKVATINDVLELQLNKSGKLIKVTNTSVIRDKWQAMRLDVLHDFPDLKEIVGDFDWQLQEEHIQQVFLEDNFYNFFFANLFNHDFKEEKSKIEQKIISNALHTITLPIKEKTTVGKDNVVNVHAEIDTEQETFPLAKLNVFLGKLPTKKGEQHDLDFQYNGNYNVNTTLGLISKGKLTYVFEVKELYKKETMITFNLEKDE